MPRANALLIMGLVIVLITLVWYGLVRPAAEEAERAHAELIFPVTDRNPAVWPMDRTWVWSLRETPDRTAQLVLVVRSQRKPASEPVNPTSPRPDGEGVQTRRVVLVDRVEADRPLQSATATVQFVDLADVGLDGAEPIMLLTLRVEGASGRTSLGLPGETFDTCGQMPRPRWSAEGELHLGTLVTRAGDEQVVHGLYVVAE